MRRTTLAGRKEESSVLQEAYYRTAILKQRPELVVVTGPSGRGKSFFVNNSIEDILSRKALQLTISPGNDDGHDKQVNLFISGDCNRVMCNEPFYCITDAFTMCCNQIMNGNDVSIPKLKSDILNGLDGDGWILTELLPCFQSIVGKQIQPLDSFGKEERIIRLKATLRCLVRAITTQATLIMHLDDLQWVDEASLDLLQTLITDKKLTNFLAICSFRDGDDNDASLNELDDFLQKLQDEQNPVSRVYMKPLTLVQTHDIIRQKLCISTEEADSLAEFVHNHTCGNACFVTRLVGYLQNKGFITISSPDCDDDSNVEETKLERVVPMDEWKVPTTLADMLVDEMMLLPGYVRDFLARAAAIGFYFDNFTINLVMAQCHINDSIDQIPSFKMRDSISSALEIAVKRDYIIKVGTLGHQFTHDSLCSAAYNMLSGDLRASLHLQTGRVLLKNAGYDKPSQPRSSTNSQQSSSVEKPRVRGGNAGLVSLDKISGFIDRHLCVIVSQMNRGKELITSDTEQLSLISLNLRAAQIHMRSSSWKVAQDYLRTGIDLLSVNCWDEQYEQSVHLYTALSEVALSTGDFDTMDKSIELVLKNGRSVDDTYEVHRHSIQSLKIRKTSDYSFQLPVKVLGELGVPVKWDKLRKIDRYIFLFKLKQQLKKETCASIISRPNLEDERKIKAMNLILDIGPLSMGTNMEHFCSGTIITHCLKYGICEALVPALLSFIFSNVMPSKNEEFSRAANNMCNKIGSNSTKLLATAQLHGYINHNSNPLSLSLDPLWEGHKLAVKTGLLEYASYCGTLFSSYSYFLGKNLDWVTKKIMLVLEWMDDYDVFGSNRLGFLPYLQAVKCLQGLEECPYSLDGSITDLNDMKKQAHDSSLVACTLTLCRLELYCLFHKYDEAGKLLDSAPDVRHLRKGHFSCVRFTFYECYASIFLSRSSSERNIVNKWKMRAKKNLKMIKKWARSGNVNCVHLIPLLQAEMEANRGRRKEALKLFTKIMSDNINETTANDDFLQDKALSLENAGFFFKDIGNEEFSKECFSHSRTLFLKWGAKAKVNAIDNR